MFTRKKVQSNPKNALQIKILCVTSYFWIQKINSFNDYIRRVAFFTMELTLLKLLQKRGFQPPNSRRHMGVSSQVKHLTTQKLGYYYSFHEARVCTFITLVNFYLDFQHGSTQVWERATFIDLSQYNTLIGGGLQNWRIKNVFRTNVLQYPHKSQYLSPNL